MLNMHDPRLLIALALVLGGLIAFDHLRTKTGGARTRLGTLPQQQPGGFRRYFHSDWTVLLGFCLGVIAYAPLWGFQG